MIHPSKVILFALLIIVLGCPTTTVSANCVEEFDQCVTNRDCCGHEDRAIECVTGDWEITTDSTCLSERSQELEAISKENGFDHQSLTVLLKHHIYQLPKIREQHTKRFRDKKIDPQFHEKIAKKYRHEFAKLVVNLERKYKISDPTAMPKLIGEFLTWKETADIAEVFAKGLPDEKDGSKSEF